MANPWSVKPQTDKYDLTFQPTDGDPRPFWITLKRRLTIGEDRAARMAGWRSMNAKAPKPGEESSPDITIDFKTQSFARTLAYLADWSLADDEGRKLALTTEIVESLDPDLFEVIENAITTHVEAMETLKKSRAGGAMPSATSA